MTSTLTQRLQRAVALRDAASLGHEFEYDFLREAPSIVQLAVELGAEVERLRKELKVIADADPRKWVSECRDQFQLWAQDRARHAIKAIGEQSE